MLTAYDAPTARALDRAGIDCLLVGDSVAMTVQGRETTLSVTLDQMIYHGEIVARVARRALVVIDLPFGSYQTSVAQAIDSAVRCLKETRAKAVKLEGGRTMASTIAALTSAGIPVMAHIGLTPQAVHQLGGYKIQRDEERLLEDAHAVAQAGAFAVVLECVPASAAAAVTAALTIPTIGIGAGPHCDGQVLVIHDLLGSTDGFQPKFARRYDDFASRMTDAARRFAAEVAQRTFPGPEESFEIRS
jgi:3-methyl-2-oxobutanoate hydroxymethyltransferase